MNLFEEKETMKVFMDLTAYIGPKNYITGMVSRGDSILITTENGRNFMIQNCKSVIEVNMEYEELQLLIDKQAEDEGLWFEAEYATEEYLQYALRKLHETCEKLLQISHNKNIKEIK